ncbi:MAG: VOC family protein [Actinomycetota bacterium]
MALGAQARVEVDHVLIAVDDLAEADRALRSAHGLSSIEGGLHPDWGTANRIVPLGDAYIELVAVVDDSQASRTAFGRWVGEVLRPCLLGWAARTSELDIVARRLNLVPTKGERARPDGQTVRWRIAGIEHAAETPFLPFFIEWDRETSLPGRAHAAHAEGPMQLAGLQFTGPAEQLGTWLGPHELAIEIGPGAPAMEAVVLTGASGAAIVLERVPF